MKNQIAYLCWEAVRGFKADKFLTVTSVITIGICTSVLSLMLLILFGAWNITKDSESDAAVRVFVRNTSENPNALKSLEGQLRNLSGIDSVVFISKDDAWMEFKGEFGEDMLRSLEFNPLPHSFWLYPSKTYRSASRLNTLRQRLTWMPEIEAVSGDSQYAAWLDKWKAPGIFAAILVMVFVAGALALIIHNAVKLNLYARRLLVENMKYCGAAEWFILTPFLLEGILLGLMGSCIGVGVLAFGKYIAKLIAQDFAEAIPFGFCAMLILGLTSLIACLASVRTVRHFLRGNLA
jgi:cell division transport system permease protein